MLAAVPPLRNAGVNAAVIPGCEFLTSGKTQTPAAPSSQGKGRVWFGFLTKSMVHTGSLYPSRVMAKRTHRCPKQVLFFSQTQAHPFLCVETKDAGSRGGSPGNGASAKTSPTKSSPPNVDFYLFSFFFCKPPCAFKPGPSWVCHPPEEEAKLSYVKLLPLNQMRLKPASLCIHELCGREIKGFITTQTVTNDMYLVPSTSGNLMRHTGGENIFAFQRPALNGKFPLLGPSSFCIH